MTGDCDVVGWVLFLPPYFRCCGSTTCTTRREKKPAVGGPAEKKKFKIGFGGISKACLRNLLKKNAPDQYVVIEARRTTGTTAGSTHSQTISGRRRRENRVNELSQI